MNNNIVVVDFETGGLNCNEHEAISIGAKAYNGRTLEPYGEPGGDGEFYSLMKPLDFNKLTPGAMAVNKIDVADLRKAPEQKLVWKRFVDWMKQWNLKSGAKTAPHWAGKNVPFDKGFYDVLMKLYFPKPPILFNGKHEHDLDDMWFDWFENENEPHNMKADTIFPWLGFDSEGAHNAIVDCRRTGAVIMRIFQLHRNLQKKLNRQGEKMIQFKNSFAGMGI